MKWGPITVHIAIRWANGLAALRHRSATSPDLHKALAASPAPLLLFDPPLRHHTLLLLAASGSHDVKSCKEKKSTSIKHKKPLILN